MRPRETCLAPLRLPRGLSALKIAGMITMRPLLCMASLFSLGFEVAYGQTPTPQPVQMEFVLQFGGKGDEPGKFHSPIGIAINARDELFITEFHTNRVQKFSSDGSWLAAYPVIEYPSGIAVDREGRMFVAALLEHKIYVYEATGKLPREWGRKGTGDGQFHEPGGLAIESDGSLLVADQCNHRMQRFTPEGKFLAKWGTYGNEPGQFGGKGKQGLRFGGPHFVALDSEGLIWTTEGANGRIQRFSNTGTPLLQWGSNSTDPGGFGGRKKAKRNALPGPIAVVVDARNRLWVSSSNDRVQAFTMQGAFLGGLLEAGSGPGQLSLPHGMVFDSKGFLYVVDSSNQRVQKFRVK